MVVNNIIFSILLINTVNSILDNQHFVMKQNMPMVVNNIIFSILLINAINSTLDDQHFVYWNENVGIRLFEYIWGLGGGGGSFSGTKGNHPRLLPYT